MILLKCPTNTVVFFCSLIPTSTFDVHLLVRWLIWHSSFLYASQHITVQHKWHIMLWTLLYIVVNKLFISIEMSSQVPCECVYKCYSVVETNIATRNIARFHDIAPKYTIRSTALSHWAFVCALFLFPSRAWFPVHYIDIYFIVYGNPFAERSKVCGRGKENMCKKCKSNSIKWSNNTQTEKKKTNTKRHQNKA